MPELTVISPYKSCTFSYLLGGHHSFNRVADSKCQGQQGEQQKPSQTKASSQPTSRQTCRQQASLREQLDPRGRLTTLATRSSANKLRIKAEWLQPPQNASIQQGKAWLKLKGKLDTLGSRPACSTDPHPGAQLICSALTQLSVHFNATPAISGYRTAAVLESTGSGAAIVVAFESKTCLKNKPSRLIGSEGFRQQILKRRGELVLLAPPRAGVGDKSLVVQQEAVHTHQARGSKCSGTAKLSADRSPGLLRRSSCIC
ncbi:hypothetical protein WJX79_002212 [Trebouxia sp. C0005]